MDATVVASMSIDAILAALAPPPSSPGAPLMEAVIKKTDLISFTVPAGTSTEDAKIAVAVSLTPTCVEPKCKVAYRSSRRVLRALQAAGSFAVTTTLDTSSNGTLAPPSVDATTLALSLNVSTGAIGAVATQTESILAEVTTVTLGDANTVAAQQAAANQQASLSPASLATALGVSSTAFTSVTITVTPPMPPPLTPPPAFPPVSPPAPLPLVSPYSSPLTQSSPSASTVPATLLSPPPPVVASPITLAPAPLSLSAPSSAQSNGAGSGGGIGMIAGAAGGGVVAVVALLLLICRAKKVRSTKDAKSSASTVPTRTLSALSEPMPAAPPLPNSTTTVDSIEMESVVVSDTEAAATALQKHARSKSARNQVASRKAALTATAMAGLESTHPKALDDVGAALAGLFSNSSTPQQSGSRSNEKSRNQMLDASLLA